MGRAASALTFDSGEVSYRFLLSLFSCVCACVCVCVHAGARLRRFERTPTFDGKERTMEISFVYVRIRACSWLYSMILCPASNKLTNSMMRSSILREARRAGLKTTISARIESAMAAM